MRDFTGGYARTTVQQNLVLRWVRPESLYDLWLRLKDLTSARRRLPGRRRRQLPRHRQLQARDHASMGLNQALQKRIEEMKITDPLTKQIHIKMSGCPNGLLPAPHRDDRLLRRLDQGRRPRDPRLHPAHRRQLRGRRRRLRPPAQGAAAREAGPDAVERWIRNYEEKRNNGENFNAFVDRTGTEQFEELISDLKLPVEFNAENLYFIDWNRSEPYKVERGEGECAV